VWDNIVKDPSVDPGDRSDAIMALRWQEAHLAQVRSLILDYDMFRRTVARHLRDQWQTLLRQWLVDRLSRSSANSTTTVLRWAVSVASRLPQPMPPAAIASVIKGLAALRPMRPVNRLRGVVPQARAALDQAAGEVRSEDPLNAAVWFVLVLMIHAWRRSDAVRVAAGEVLALEWLSANEAAIWPESEKTDMFGEREVEPSVVVFEDTRLAAAAIKRLPVADTDRLERLVSQLLHSHGVADVRALRRDAAAATGSRDDAAVLLRHRPGSRHTLRYATTRDAIPRARGIANRVVTFAD
jgi:hypothetical protein